MDFSGADAFLAEILEHLRKANAIQRDGGDYWVDARWLEENHQALAMLVAARRIVSELDPDLGGQLGPETGLYATVWLKAEDVVMQARGILSTSERLAAIMGPVGPAIAASQLHHWVWDSASSAWENKMFRVAVHLASTRIDTETQVKLGRFDVSGVDLGRQAWSADGPQEGKPRLRPVGLGGQGSASFRSALEGSRDFRSGVMARIRNLASHHLDELGEQEALEQFAALSVLARWVEAAEVARA